MNKNVLTAISIILGLFAAVVFIMIPTMTASGKVICGLLWVVNAFLSFNANKWQAEDKFAIPPVLSYLAQVGLSFLIVATTA